MQATASFPNSLLQLQLFFFFFFCDRFVVCHFTGLKRQTENASQYEAYFIRFLNTKKQLHQHGNDVDALCKPFETFRLIGCIPIFPVCPQQSGGG